MADGGDDGRTDAAAAAPVSLRRLAPAEFDLVWTVDRSETATHAYRLVDGELVVVPRPFTLTGWPAGMREHDAPGLAACAARGGVGLGAFAGETLVGTAVVDTRPLGPTGAWRQLAWCYVSAAWRGQGVGGRLLEAARAAGRELGGEKLYISAIPTVATVDFYRGQGAVLAEPPDPALLAAEPEDIHLVCPCVEPRLSPRRREEECP